MRTDSFISQQVRRYSFVSVLLNDCFQFIFHRLLHINLTQKIMFQQLIRFKRIHGYSVPAIKLQ